MRGTQPVWQAQPMIYGAEHANVQPHSGATANAALMMALAKPGDRILGLSLAHGGHLTHGMKLNFSGQMYEAHAYELHPETFLIDMDMVRERALETRPEVITVMRYIRKYTR